LELDQYGNLSSVGVFRLEMNTKLNNKNACSFSGSDISRREKLFFGAITRRNLIKSNWNQIIFTMHRLVWNQTDSLECNTSVDWWARQSAWFLADLCPAGPVAQLVTCAVSCRTASKWFEFDPRDVQQLFGTPFSKVSLR